jgi:transcriptional regulator of aromatic amino acid metabolism
VRPLRVLQDGTLERVGGHRPLSVDVRIVAATHRSLHAMIASGVFRQDLWYRIAVFSIEIPALRERVADIPDSRCTSPCAGRRASAVRRSRPRPRTSTCSPAIPGRGTSGSSAP